MCAGLFGRQIVCMRSKCTSAKFARIAQLAFSASDRLMALEGQDILLSNLCHPMTDCKERWGGVGGGEASISGGVAG